MHSSEMKFDDIPKEMRAEAGERREMLIGMLENERSL